MKLKAALKYQINGMLRPLIVFYIVIFALLIIMGIEQAIASRGGIRLESSGLEVASAIFIFIVGLNSFKSTFHLFLANGISRKTMFKSYLGAIAPLAALLALVDAITIFILSSIANFGSLFFQMYHPHYGSVASFGGNMQVFIDSFLWMLFLYIALAMAGFFITTIYYRMNKSLKLIVSIGVPVLLLIVLPYVDSYIFHGAIFDAIEYVYTKALGYRDGCNPYIAVLSSFIAITVLSALSFLAMRRATVKE